MDPTTLAATALASTLAALYVAPYPIKLRQRRALRLRCREQRCVVLSYDDGPSDDITPPLLELLANRGARATFFLRGDRAASNPRLVDRIFAEGHEIGCHSARHYHPWTTAPWKLTRDMREGYELLSRWMRSDGPYRPPFGKPYLPVFLHLAMRHARLAWWTIDTGDTFATRPPIEITLAALRAAGGGVVLMHDWREDSDAHRAYILNATSRVLDLARSEGLAVKRLNEIF